MSLAETVAPLLAVLAADRGELDARTVAHRAAVADRPAALNLLVFGDSWTDYPLDEDLPLVRTDLVAQLSAVAHPAPAVLNLAHYGNTTTQAFGLDNQRRALAAIRDPAHGRFDAILASAGGNDIAGDSLALWLSDAGQAGSDPARGVCWDRFGDALAGVRAAYSGLIAFRNRYLPHAPIFVHGYDYPVVSGRGVYLLGPWLKPALSFCGWSDPAAGGAIVRSMIDDFGALLDNLSAVRGNNLVHVRTAGALTAAEWANELHPTPAGFRRLAEERLRPALAAVFPGRV